MRLKETRKTKGRRENVTAEQVEHLAPDLRQQGAD